MKKPSATRGAQKLEAALRNFGVAQAIAGARAIDVGVSTGGFTAVLLAHGASEVSAIEVGHGQLLPALRGDPRVRLYERTDFRRASLTLAPGPFAFFSVDVSFMAARNVMRSLAFRLESGAQGVVLLKPQFELPRALVHGGDVSDPKLRARALQMFRERAEALGFEVLAEHDSEVTGGSGTRELFLHLSFAGRPATLPRLGERRGQKAESTGRREGGKDPRIPGSATASERSAAPVARDLKHAWFAVAAPGLEAVLARELTGLPAVTGCEVVAGGVAFRGPIDAGWAANLGSRLASRVLLRLGTVEARHFGSLRRALARLPFEQFLPQSLPLRVSASAQRSRLYHTGALAEAVVHAIADRGGGAPTLTRSGNDDELADASEPDGHEAFTRVLLRGDDNQFTLSIDSSGELLHRRGARIEAGRAPLRETLAAGLLWLADYDPSVPLVNAMCGAGTIALEAAELALGRAPGLRRRFAFERFPGFDPARFAALRQAFEQRARSTLAARVIAFDRDRRALERARRNLERAALTGRVELAQADFSAFAPPPPPGLLIANPPYGQRLGNAREAAALQRAIGAQLRSHYRGWRVALLLPRAVRARTLGLEHAQSIPLQNGGIPVQLLIATI